MNWQPPSTAQVPRLWWHWLGRGQLTRVPTQPPSPSQVSFTVQLSASLQAPVPAASGGDAQVPLGSAQVGVA